ncbi:acyl-[acyl-carrier-protein] thioesterase [Clostridium sp. HCP1S3_B4]|uniref:acyl-[acyl-carrier-protein] thioesterase n=1 Tax=unclassified Clostridium TaxID=2614128 RepID=UPI002A7857C7|nr:thioesterase [Clostridiales bacterium]MDY2729748.1 thioesterase [Clostridium sp.]
MVNKEISFSKKYEINYYDVDCNLKCKLASIVNFLCDVGNSQSESLGETIDCLTEQNFAWVFFKYDIKVNKYPKYRDVVTVTTAATGFNRFYAYRGYEITDEEGNILVEATALFFLIDIKKRRAARISQDKIELYSKGVQLPKKVEMDEARDLTNEDYFKEFNIRYSDIDSNGHVNNVKYMEWAIESVPIEIIQDYELNSIKVTFEKETVYGESVHVSAQIIKEDDKITTVHVIKSKEGKVLTKIEIDWKK